MLSFLYASKKDDLSFLQFSNVLAARSDRDFSDTNQTNMEINTHQQHIQAAGEFLDSTSTNFSIFSSRAGYLDEDQMQVLLGGLKQKSFL